MLSPCCTDARTHVLNKRTPSEPLKMKTRDCINLGMTLRMGRGEIHQRVGKGTMVKPRQALKRSPAELQSGREIPSGESLKCHFIEENMQSWPSLFNIYFSLWQFNSLQKTEIKSPNTPKYIQGETENDISSRTWCVLCTFSVDKLGMVLG